jgi:hypothetical protein
MFERIFPRQIDNTFRGHWLSLWLFGAYALVKAIQGGESLFNARMTAARADGIPLDSYGSAAADMVVHLFSLLGLNVLVLPLLALVALIRYRAMVPLVYVTMLLLALAGRVFNLMHATASVGGVQPIGFYVNLGLLAVLVIGFILSLVNRPAR